MLIKSSLISRSEQRFKDANFSPERLDKQLGDGPMGMSAAKEQQRRQQLLAETRDPHAAEIGLERIINGNDLDSINYLLKGTLASHSICRIQLKDSSGNLIGYATGFLIGPNVLMTNHHVFGKTDDAKNSIANFDYELDINGADRRSIDFAFEPQKLFYANVDLDYAIVAIAPVSRDGGRMLAEWRWLPLSGEPGKGDPGEYLTIIQHPGGQMKQVCVRENKLLKYMDNFVWYLTDTTAGSSGSPAFNRFWQVIALHHCGVPQKDEQGRILTTNGGIWDSSMDESQIQWIANEGVRVSAIVADLRASVGAHPLVKPVLDQVAPPATAESVIAPADNRGPRADLWVEQSGDAASLVIPLRVPIPLVRRDVVAPFASAIVAPQPAVAPPAPAVVTRSADLAVEAVHIDHSTLDERPGYQPDFLGGGKLVVPLPGIPASLKSAVAPHLKDKSQSELKYFNYSVVMNKTRKLAFFSVVNIDGSEQQDVGKREGDSWLRDPRIDAKFQIGNEFYGKQSTLEADRSANPFDRGHLVRRLDATWGGSVDEAKEHGDDSFHFTNCSPQFWSFNQGKALWAGLEDFTRDTLLENKNKGVVMNGPIFDGPDASDTDLPDSGAPSRKDPSFGGVMIPKYFWKIMVTSDGGKLKALAFIVSQRNLIMAIDRIQELSAAQVRVFQVSVDTVARLTKLDFGPVAEADAFNEAAVGPKLIESLSDIRI